jgi:GNAT superfamily N-acetyltransferase
MSASEFERARAFVLANDEAGADRVEPWEHGSAVLSPTTPRLWDANYLRVDRLGELDAPTLVAAADHVLEPVGARGRAVVVPDGAAAQPLRPGFRALGWESDRLLFMVLRGTPRQRPGAPVVDEVERAEVAELQRELFLAEPEPVGGAGVANEVHVREGRVMRDARVRWFGLRVGGRVVASCSLVERDRVFEVDGVNTLPAHRRGGLGRAAVVAAAASAQRDGAELVFLGAYQDDWPHRWYLRLGFAPVGMLMRFRRG